VTNNYFIQLIGVLLTVAGLIALTASARFFGTPLSNEEKRRASDEWNHRRDTYRLPIDLEAIVAAAFFLGGNWHPHRVEIQFVCVSCVLDARPAGGGKIVAFMHIKNFPPASCGK
jgi:hypothetical protein